ncbi:MAG TPA: hypothetical protein VK714_03720 [Myxococcota bacterium]|nr:hypothetical protein [Myxococcota bacterium]
MTPDEMRERAKSLEHEYMPTAEAWRQTAELSERLDQLIQQNTKPAAAPKVAELAPTQH